MMSSRIGSLGASVNDSRPLITDLTETAAVVSRSIAALGSLAVPTRFRFGPNDGVPPIIGTGFVVAPRGVVSSSTFEGSSGCTDHDALSVSRVVVAATIWA